MDLQPTSTVLVPGDAVQLGCRTPYGAALLNTLGNVWIVQRILPYVWCLDGKPGILVQASRLVHRRWIAFPNDPHFVILEKLGN